MVKHREDGLKKGISEDNIGHRLLKRMGYKKGDGLGKKKSGRTKPIEINIKTGRSGIGREKRRKRKSKEKYYRNIERYKNNEQECMRDFRRHSKSRVSLCKKKYDLPKCARECESLDMNAGIESNDLWIYGEQEYDEDGYEIEKSTEKILTELTSLLFYMRKKHHYCHYCSIKFDSKRDMERNCPGALEEDHEVTTVSDTKQTWSDFDDRF